MTTPESARPDRGYNGLTTVQPTLPRDWYLDTQHYQREMSTIWYKQWLFVCRTEDLAEARSYRIQQVGDQQVIVLRDEHGELQAFHNTCRHRGSQLLGDDAGLLRSDSLTCPYHAWSYTLQGELKRIPSQQRAVNLDTSCLALYRVAVDDWRGFIFINLDPQTPLLESFDQPQALGNWPLETLRSGYSLRKTMNCNWKIFWENFNECLHCPGVHPELSRLVPLYRQFLMEVQDDPDWQSRLANDPRFKGGLAEGMHSWTADGQLVAPVFPDLDKEELERGHTYVTSLPTGFIVGHADYVRLVSLLPLDASNTELQVHWFFSPQVLSDPDFDAAAVASFAEMVVMQDAGVSEINQRGLAALPHEAGVLMPEEYEVYNFQQWVRRQLGE